MRRQTLHVAGAFTDVKDSVAYPGQLGMVVYDRARDAHFQLVQMSNGNSGDDAATPTPAAKLLAYWCDSKAFKVCTHIEAAEGGVNSVAGVLQAALTSGKYGWIQKSGKAQVIGDDDITSANTTKSVGRVVSADGEDRGSCGGTAVGTASLDRPVGVIISVTSPYSSTSPLVQLSLMRGE